MPNEGFLAVAMFFLFLGAFFGGATVVGGEWRAGTVTTVLTWEPRRLRLHAARTSSAAILLRSSSRSGSRSCSLASFLPAVFLNGTTEGADVSFWTALVVVMIRTSVLSAGAAVLAIALATVGRNTAFALITMFTWLIVVEGLIRGLKPSLSEWLWAENIGTVMTWAQLDEPNVSRGPVIASATLIVYCATIVGLAAASFQRRDIAAAT